jgi:hypothetical protein
MYVCPLGLDPSHTFNWVMRDEKEKKEKKRKRKKKEREKVQCSYIWLGPQWDRTAKDRMMTTNKLCIIFFSGLCPKEMTNDVSGQQMMFPIRCRYCFFFLPMIILLSFLVYHFTNERITEECEPTEDWKKRKMNVSSHVNVNYIVQRKRKILSCCSSLSMF